MALQVGEVIGEHTRPPYLVDVNRLNESDWLEHIAEKIWVDLNDFVPLYLRSLSPSMATNSK